VRVVLIERAKYQWQAFLARTFGRAKHFILIVASKLCQNRSNDRRGNGPVAWWWSWRERKGPTLVAVGTMVEGMDRANGWHGSFSENVPISVPIVVGTLDKNDPHTNPQEQGSMCRVSYVR